MSTFIIAIFLLLITPGPGVLSTAGVGAAFGHAAGYRYVFGLFVGSNLVSLAVVTGLAGIMFSVPALRQVLLVLSALYLFYLAARIALSGSRIAFIDVSRPPGIINGIALQTINPKAYVVATTLFSGFAFEHSTLLMETVLKFLLINAFWVPIHILWLNAGITLKNLNLGERKQRAINFIMAVLLLLVVALALFGAPEL